ncbi:MULTISPECIES: hypothetical protein [unclassified Streptomyces]|uniref:hypothetical protein n=1 Tax=unclassified Streptomyces TaxID=2593676 RepID=UPI000A80C94B|nr:MULTISPECIES: hypothetical protein [unclassified Streptomyces]
MRRPFHSPLARWGFTACALLAAATSQPWPALTATAAAIYAWRTPRRRRTRSPK